MKQSSVLQTNESPETLVTEKMTAVSLADAKVERANVANRDSPPSDDETEVQLPQEQIIDIETQLESVRCYM